MYRPPLVVDIGEPVVAATATASSAIDRRSGNGGQATDAASTADTQASSRTNSARSAAAATCSVRRLVLANTITAVIALTQGTGPSRTYVAAAAA